jgi:glycine betaine/choline ABC-type transport system substrate-binding protein
MNLRILKDDKHFFPAYQAGIVVRNEILQQYPELKGLLERLGNTINDAEMLRLNYEVEIEKKSPNEVATGFLNKNKLAKLLENE